MSAAGGGSVADITPKHVAVAVAIFAAGGLFYAGTRQAGPVRLVGPLTELEGPSQDFQEHLAHGSELLTEPVMVPHRYPQRTAPGTTETIHQGFAPLYAIPDPQVAALPAESAW